MFARVATIFTFLFFILPFLASAIAIEARGGGGGGGGVSQCNVGTVQCCNQVQSANSSPVNVLAGLLGIVLGPLTGQVGINCTSISVIGVGGNSCSAQPVCCTGNNFSGLLVVGCTPININL